MESDDRPVAILCGGRGTRLGYPGQKCMVPILGRPFLAYKIDQLYDLGATSIHLLVSYESDEVRDYFGSWPTYHEDPGHGVTLAHRLASRTLPFVHWVTYGDCLLDAPLHESSMPYVWVNEAHPDDAGLMMAWGSSFLFHRKQTDAPSYHINTPADLARTEEYLRARVH